MPEIGIERLKVAERPENKEIRLFCSVVGLYYLCYEKMVDSTLERLGLSEHIPEIKHPHLIEFLVEPHEADKFLLPLGTETNLLFTICDTQ